MFLTRSFKNDPKLSGTLPSDFALLSSLLSLWAASSPAFYSIHIIFKISKLFYASAALLFLYISCAFPILLVTAWQECGRYQLKWHHSHSIRPTHGPHGFVRQDLNLDYFAFCCSSAAHYSAPICNSVFFGFSTFASLSGTLPSQLGNATSLQCL